MSLEELSFDNVSTGACSLHMESCGEVLEIWLALVLWWEERIPALTLHISVSLSLESVKQRLRWSLL